MVTRLRSDKGSFVQSLKKAFDTDVGFEFTAQYFIQLASATQPERHFLFNPISCSRSNQALATGNPGPGEDWIFTIDEVGGQPWPRTLIQNMVFSQPPSVQTIDVAVLLLGTATCNEFGTWDNYWAAPSEPGSFGGFDAWDRQFAIVDDTIVASRNRWSMFKHPGSTLVQAHFPTDWTPGNVDVVLN